MLSSHQARSLVSNSLAAGCAASQVARTSAAGARVRIRPNNATVPDVIRIPQTIGDGSASLDEYIRTLRRERGSELLGQVLRGESSSAANRACDRSGVAPAVRDQHR